MNRRNFIGAASGIAASAAFPSASVRAATETRLGRVRLHVAEPAQPSSGAVLLLPTIAAIDDYMKKTAAELAGLGHLAVVWDPYDGEQAPTEVMAQVIRSKRLDDETVIRDLVTVVDHLVEQRGITRLATIGWCLGGRFALLIAGRDRRIVAASAYNPTIYSRWPVPISGTPTSKADFPGQTLDEFALASGAVATVEVVRPGNDLTQAADYAELQTALYSRSYPTTFAYYPEAEHGFVYKRDTPANRAAADLAWPSTLGLLQTALTSAS